MGFREMGLFVSAKIQSMYLCSKNFELQHDVPSSDALLPTRFLKNSNFLENFSNNFENFLSWKYNSVTWGTFSHRNSLLAESLSYTFPLWTKVFLSKSVHFHHNGKFVKFFGLHFFTVLDSLGYCSRMDKQIFGFFEILGKKILGWKFSNVTNL